MSTTKRLIFQTIATPKEDLRAQEIDYGRCDLDQSGLMIFEDRLGIGKKLLTYL